MILPYLLVGVLLGLSDAPLRGLLQRWIGTPKPGTALIINIFMPLATIILAAIYPRMRVVLLGAPLLSLGFEMGARARAANVLSPRWRADLFVQVHPILVVATLGYLLLGVLSVATVRNWRRVGKPDDPSRCRQCGYSLIGLSAPRCPECGLPVRQPRG
jgi:hypothetical protein